MTTRLLALLAALSLAVVACGDDDDQEAQGVTTTTEATTSTSETPPQETTTTIESPSDHGIIDAEGTARDWIDAIATGDDERAMALVSDRAMEAFGGEDGYRENEIALAEGWGAWDFADPLEATEVTVDETLSIVVLHGDVPQEGPPDESWAALPVVATPEGDRVEPFVQLGEPEVQPPANTEIAPDGPLQAYVLAGREVWFIVDDGDAEVPALEGADGDQQVGTIQTSGLEPGLHAFIVVQRNDDGVMARTYLYGVEG